MIMGRRMSSQLGTLLVRVPTYGAYPVLDDRWGWWVLGVCVCVCLGDTWTRGCGVELQLGPGFGYLTTSGIFGSVDGGYVCIQTPPSGRVDEGYVCMFLWPGTHRTVSKPLLMMTCEL